MRTRCERTCRLALAELDDRGCNWTMQTFTGDRSHYKLVAFAMLVVKQMWNLA